MMWTWTWVWVWTWLGMGLGLRGLGVRGEVWSRARARPLFANVETLEFDEATLGELRGYGGPVVSIVGGYHTGKSTCLNHLQENRSVGDEVLFAVGATPEPQTRGIDVAFGSVGGREVLLLDAEGFFSVAHSPARQALLFAVATLAADVTLFNTVRNPGNTREVDELGTLAKATEVMRVQSWFAERGVALEMPHLVYLVQNADTTTDRAAVEYLEPYLRRFAHEQYAMENVFRGVECVMMPTPRTQVRPPRATAGHGDAYVVAMEKLRDTVIRRFPVSTSRRGSLVETLRALATLLRGDVTAALATETRSLAQLRQTFVRDGAWATAVQHHKKASLPMMASEQLRARLRRLTEQCVTVFETRQLGSVVDNTTRARLRAVLGKMDQERLQQNARAVDDHCAAQVDAAVSRGRRFNDRVRLPVKTLPTFAAAASIAPVVAEEPVAWQAQQRTQQRLGELRTDLEERNRNALYATVQRFGQRMERRYDAYMRGRLMAHESPPLASAALADLHRRARVHALGGDDDQLPIWIQEDIVYKTHIPQQLHTLDTTALQAFQDLNDQRVRAAVTQVATTALGDLKQQLARIAPFPDEDDVVAAKIDDAVRAVRHTVTEAVASYATNPVHAHGLAHLDQSVAEARDRTLVRNLNQQTAILTEPLADALATLTQERGAVACPSLPPPPAVLQARQASYADYTVDDLTATLAYQARTTYLLATCHWHLAAGFHAHATHVAHAALRRHGVRLSTTFRAKIITHWVRKELAHLTWSAQLHTAAAAALAAALVVALVVALVAYYVVARYTAPKQRPAVAQ